MVTALVSPLLRLASRSSRRQPSFRRLSVQSGQPESELRLVVCIHTTRHVPAMLGLLDAANPTKHHPVSVAVLHLIELSSRPSSMLAIHSAATANDGGGPIQQQPATAAITHAFEAYEERAAGLSVRSLTAVSSYHTMHHDISGVAENFGAALVIIPFHKHHAVDGSMEPTNHSLRSLNQSILASAPCSVAVLIDRGLPAPSRFALPLHATLFFLGGPDDREALAFASRIAGHPHFSLTVLRLLHSATSENSLADDEFINEFRLRHASDNSVVYTETVAASAQDTVAALRSLDEGRHDLYIVGKGGGDGTQFTAGLTDWSECPELGPIGDLLASSDFGVAVSVLVVQQCSGSGIGESESAAGPGKSKLTSSKERLSMISADKETYRTRSLAGRRK